MLTNKISQALQAIKTFLKETGGRHFTIMVIPHTEKKIFSFQVSNYIIFYMLVITAFSVFTIYHSQSRKKELINNLEDIQTQDKEYWEKYRSYARSIDENLSAFGDYRGEINKMMKVIGLPDKGMLWDAGRSRSSEKKKLNSELKKEYSLGHHNVPDNILELSALSDDLQRTTQHLTVIEKVLENRKDILAHIPSRWPLYGNVGYKTSPFGKRYSPFLGRKMFHTGVDIAAAPRTPILAAAEGRVSFAGIKRGYGYTVVLQHKYGYLTLYGHNTRLLVKDGQKVRKGQKIALLGKSGRATGFHVHFEIRVKGEAVDPWPYITTEL